MLSSVFLVAFLISVSYIVYNQYIELSKISTSSSTNTTIKALSCSKQFLNIKRVNFLNKSYRVVFLENKGSRVATIRNMKIYDAEGNYCYNSSVVEVGVGNIMPVFVHKCDNVSFNNFTTFVATACTYDKRTMANKSIVDFDGDGYYNVVDCDDHDEDITFPSDNTCDGDEDNLIDIDAGGCDIDDNNANLGCEKIIMYVTNESHNGNFGGRTGLDSYCLSHRPPLLNVSKVHAFISVSYSDEIVDMPSNYGYKTNLSIYLYNRTSNEIRLFFNNWTEMLSRDPDYAPSEELGNRGVWTSSYPNGSYWHEDLLGSCYGYTFSGHEFSSEGRVAIGLLKYDTVMCDDSAYDDEYRRWLGTVYTEEDNACDLSIYYGNLCSNRYCKGAYCDSLWLGLLCVGTTYQNYELKS